MAEKLKSFLKSQTFFFVAVVVGVGVSSFSLGRLSVLHELPDNGPISVPRVTQVTPSPIEVGQGVQVVDTSTLRSSDKSIATKEFVVASASGTKYHFSHCAGAKQIKEENKLYFDSATLAEAAGYTLAANCSPVE